MATSINGGTFSTDTPDFISDGVSCRFVKLKGIEFEFVKARTAVFMGAATQRQKGCTATADRGRVLPQACSQTAFEAGSEAAYS
jgi:hypothetical protein